jgi:predicted  nucleic acid-binding Zn-ribbon protein
MPECDRCGDAHATVDRTLDDGCLCPSCQERKQEQVATRELGQAGLKEYYESK